MKRFIRAFTFCVAAMVSLIGVAGLLGVALPRHHHAASRALLRAPRDSVWAAIADMEHAASWRSDLSGVRRLPDHDGRAVWEQQSTQGAWALEVTAAEPPARFVTAVCDSSQGFGGTWTWTLVREREGTRVTLAEDGFVDNPLFRFLARFVFGLHSPQQRTLRDLGRRFGQDVTPESS